MKPIGLLMMEHRLIDRAVEQIRNKAKDCKLDSSCVSDLNQLIDFLSSYSDLCHHGKEEKILFAECEYKHMPQDLRHMMEELKLEHVMFRKMREKMNVFNSEFGKGNFSNIARLNELITDFCAILKKHIDKEDSIFFPQSMKFFSEAEQEEMLKKFRDFDQGVMHEKYRKLISEFEGKGKAD